MRVEGLLYLPQMSACFWWTPPVFVGPPWRIFPPWIARKKDRTISQQTSFSSVGKDNEDGSPNTWGILHTPPWWKMLVLKCGPPPVHGSWWVYLHWPDLSGIELATLSRVLGDSQARRRHSCHSSPQKWGGGKLFDLQLELCYLQLSFFAYSRLRPLLDALSHCKQKAPTVSRKVRIVSKKSCNCN